MSGFDAVDGSSTGTSVPRMWALLRLPLFLGDSIASSTRIRFSVHTPGKLVKLTWFARPLRVNTLLHCSALVAHGPVSSNALTSQAGANRDCRNEDQLAKHNHRFSSWTINDRSAPVS
jgi:hypothetical protein